MFLYLHGFASGPQSSKAQRFRHHFGERGLSLEIPALDEGDFEHLTLGRQRALVERLLAGAPRPHVLIGSSMGGYLALLHAEVHPVDALIVMAPAVDFANRWQAQASPGALEAWERTGTTRVEHHVQGKRVPLAYDLVRDAPNHSPWPRVEAPTLVFQGTRDEVVPLSAVQAWTDRTPSARLVTLDTDHVMAEVTDHMALESLRFLAGLPAVAATFPGR